MNQLNVTDIHGKSATELKDMLADLMRVKFKMRLKKNCDESIKPHMFWQVRRNIAQVKTVLNANKKGDN
jgi:ribosomal protein L29